MIFEEKLSQFRFDMKEYLRRFDGTPQLYQECLVLYVGSGNIDKLTESFGKGDWKAALEYAHMLKGSSSNLALRELWDIYDSIVQTLRGSEPQSAAPMIEKAAELEAQLKEITQGMKKIRRCKDGYTNY